jgi:predicted patatin/cPLA2 family phospholipase
MAEERFALVLEGGGYRGAFTAGVLDVLMEHGFADDFASVWGTSAGAINATSFKSHQLGRSLRIMLAFRDDPRFMSLMSFVRTGDITGGEFVYDEVQNHLDPCDNDSFNENPLEMYVVATDVVFGSAAYLPVRALPDDIACVRASASLPPVSNMVEIGGHRYLDGGTTDSIPFEAALGLPEAPSPLPEGYVPATKALVVATQDRAYVRDGGNERIALRSRRYTNYPYYLDALKTRADRYNAMRERLWALEAAGTALVIAPEKPVEVATAEHEGAPLLDLYLQGHRQAEARLAEIDAFLRSDDASDDACGPSACDSDDSEG